jgi:hypothetical protein
MYYDLIASLPHLPYFTRAEHSPITRLRLDQRLRLLRPAHAGQLAWAEALIRWRPDRLLGRTDAMFVAEYSRLKSQPLDSRLREYLDFRMEQQTILAALRRRQAGLGSPDEDWGVAPRLRSIRRCWDQPDFRLAALHPWLSQARDLLAAGDAQGLDQLLMGVAWRRLDQCAEQGMFAFAAVFAYVFKWDILQGWLACDADEGKTRFRDLIDKVTHKRGQDPCVSFAG